MADVHFHIWHCKRDSDGIIRAMERAEDRYDTRRKANYARELFRRERSLAGQVVQCVDGAFCQPPPDWAVRGATLAGPGNSRRSTSSTGPHPSGRRASWRRGWRSWSSMRRTTRMTWCGSRPALTIDAGCG